MARSWGWKVEKRRIRFTELPESSEIFGAGTAVGLVPIRSTGHYRDTIASRTPAGTRRREVRDYSLYTR